MLSFALGIAVLLSTVNMSLAAEMFDGGSNNDSTTYNGVLYAVTWTDNVSASYSTDYQNNKYIDSQVQGGCYNNANYYTQTVAGNTTYYWPGGSRGPISSTVQNQEPAFCQSGSGLWAHGRTYNSPAVMFLVYDPPGSDYVRIFSQWYCGSCTPFYLQRTRYWYWN